MKIKCLFVDLGDVIFKIDSVRANQQLSDLGIKVHFGSLQHPMIDLFEMGELTSEKFLEMLKGNLPTSQEKIINAFNSILNDSGFMVDRLEYLQSLKEKFPELKICLLSNTNEIHIKKILAEAKNQNVVNLFGDEESNGLFNERIFSCRVGARKPEELIYRRACEIGKVKPEESLFIDDNHSNIIAAERTGINTIELKTTDLKSFAHSLENFLLN